MSTPADNKKTQDAPAKGTPKDTTTLNVNAPAFTPKPQGATKTSSNTPKPAKSQEKSKGSNLQQQQQHMPSRVMPSAAAPQGMMMPPHPGMMGAPPGMMPPHPGMMPPHPGMMPPHPGMVPMPPMPMQMPPNGMGGMHFLPPGMGFPQMPPPGPNMQMQMPPNGMGGMPFMPPGMGFPQMSPPGPNMPMPPQNFAAQGKQSRAPNRPSDAGSSAKKPHVMGGATPKGSVSSTPSAEPPQITVGNAALAAVRSKEPPKFVCVQLSGIPGVGKTTLGRELVNQLKEDGMGWAFFSGADSLQETGQKRTVWETTKEVFEGLSKRLDDLIEEQQKERSIKGLVIDKNCKGIEDVYYLNALLKSKGIPFVGIVGMEVADDNVLIERMGGEQYLREKLKYHRVIHARICNLAKLAGMYRHVDASKGKEDVVRSLRTMVLGCAAQPPPPNKGIRTHLYNDVPANIMEDSFMDYYGVMIRLFECVNARAGQQFPNTSDFYPFSTKEMVEKKRVEALKNRYGVRRKVDGQNYLLIYHNEKLYLVPPHMRAVLLMPSKAWLGNKLTNVGSFVLEGNLVRLTKEPHKEKFLVFDALFWSDAQNRDSNILMRMGWNERQEHLRSHLTGEDKNTFFPPDTDCIILHQVTSPIGSAVDLLDCEDYPADGLIFQPFNAVLRTDRTLVWQQPSNISVDFRVGNCIDKKSAETSVLAGSTPKRNSVTGTEAAGGTYTLEVYDKVEKEYVQYEDATAELRHPDVVPGCMVTCSLKDEVKRGWVFKRIRYDILRPSYKHDVDEILSACLVPRAKLVSWLMTENIVSSEIQKDAPKHRQQNRNNNNNGNNAPVQAPSYQAVARGNNGPAMMPQQPPFMYPNANNFNNSNGQFVNSNMNPNMNPMGGPMPHTIPPVAPNAAAAVPPPRPQTAPKSTAEELKLLQSIVPSVHVVVKPAPAEEAVERPCTQCHKKKKAEDLRVDKRDKKLYCYNCWAKLGYGFCSVCGEFKELQKTGKNQKGGNNSAICLQCHKSKEGGHKNANSNNNNNNASNANAAGEEGQEAQKGNKKNNKKKNNTAPAATTDEKTVDESKEEKKPAEKKNKKKEKNSSAKKAPDGAPEETEKKEGEATESKEPIEEKKESSPNEVKNNETAEAKVDEDENQNVSAANGENKKSGGVCAQQ